MSEEASPKKRRSRKAHGKLRKDQHLDQVTVEEAFSFQHPIDKQVAGEGAYVSATVNSRRYYGVLVDQATLKSASLLQLQQEALGLDLNRRIKSLMPNNFAGQTLPTPVVPANGALEKQVQKFRFIDGTDAQPGHRVLLATFADAAAAADDDPEKEEMIKNACAAGGNFVGKYYYQFFEHMRTSLVPMTEKKDVRAISLSMSMGFNSFLEATVFPPWTPHINLDVGQQAVLNMLQLKKDKKGNFVPDQSTIDADVALSQSNWSGPAMIPMEPRHCFRVGVVGGGIAGLSTCLEIFRLCGQEQIEVEIHLLEGRNRLGGRLHTDKATFKHSDGVSSFPVDLGASWIHGIDMNPLAALAREAGVDFVVTSEEVKMLQGNMKEVDAEKDKKAGELFDKLLDVAAERAWSSKPGRSRSEQKSVRWYASVLDKNHKRGERPRATCSPQHRQSSDVSVDQAVGEAIAEQLTDEFQCLTMEERRMLFWNLKNVEYALGANLSDLSQMFWDIDERHAFEGDHVILRQGYTVVVDYLLRQLRSRGERFRYHLSCPVATIEYARRSTGQVYIGKTPKKQTILELSDTCCITSEDGATRIVCDFVVCAVPLGVLKHALSNAEQDDTRCLRFDPPLPFPKRDSIGNVGFGLLDKVFLQFPVAFWRTDQAGSNEHHTIFGNASGVHPHHYMFLDVGRVIHVGDDPPAILMSLVSGVEAVDCEWLSTEELTRQVMETLRKLFAPLSIPDPIRVKTTKWGSDRFSRGSYTFLGPGTTDADFHVLQSPCNGNGDSILLDGFETMRLFFAGEHTTALHPSMAHGALLSGMRAAREVFDTMNLTFESDNIDRLIPLCLYRHMYPESALCCALCKGTESSAEGPLLAFKRGSRCVCVHNNCAEASPEVEINDGKWENVVRAVNRGVLMECFFCEQSGATIGCHEPECPKSFHYSCATKTGWDFESLGKEFRCEEHRDSLGLPNNLDRVFHHELLAGSNGDTMEVENVLHTGEKVAGNRHYAGSNDTTNGAAGKIATTSLHSIRLAPSDSAADASTTRLVRITRPSLESLWNVNLTVKKESESDNYRLCVSRSPTGFAHSDLLEGDVVRLINGWEVGSPELATVDKVLSVLRQEVDVMMQVEANEL